MLVAHHRLRGQQRRRPGNPGRRHRTTTPVGLLSSLLGAFPDYERSLIREPVLGGVRQTEASGKLGGLALLNEGRWFEDTARILKIPQATLGQPLREAGRRQVVAVVEA